ncbi:hypothetical protein DPMN_125222 [Dreissena polymorpha]|uniref:Uncharacterized protein n=1 Tax=Dreissena polymorpha TaxID=45954 RepID=A0A9D4GX42_DREPO|nr:hypothetical protein DPMN_125222 [Dreissena polymorpha]
MVETLARQVQDSSRQCGNCDNANSTKTQQRLLKNTADILVNTTTKTQTSEFTLESLKDAIGQNDSEDVAVSVSWIVLYLIVASAYTVTNNKWKTREPKYSLLEMLG